MNSNSNSNNSVARVIIRCRKNTINKNNNSTSKIINRCKYKNCRKELVSRFNQKYCNKWCYQMAKLDINVERFKMLVIKGNGI